jgi:hypothetical protein
MTHTINDCLVHIDKCVICQRSDTEGVTFENIIEPNIGTYTVCYICSQIITRHILTAVMDFEMLLESELDRK